MTGFLTAGRLRDFKENAAVTINLIGANFREAAERLEAFDPEGAGAALALVSQQLRYLRSQTDEFGWLKNFLSDLPAAFNRLAELTALAAKTADDFNYLKSDAVGLMLYQKGEALIGLLERLQNNSRQMAELIGQLEEQTRGLNYPLPAELGPLKTKLYLTEQTLLPLIDWLKNPTPQHLLLLFQNPSEIRPAGGFLGSYADVVFDRGSLVNLEVRDIYDSDGQLDSKIIPPEPLQEITVNWGSRDANWFFDFPTSARKVIQFLEASKIYKERGTEWSGAIALNVRVIEDLLRLTGPVDLPEKGLTVDDRNFLTEVQREVETAKNKTILKLMTPIIFERLAKLSPQQKESFLRELGGRLKNKDIMLYFEDLVMEAQIKNWRAGGEMLDLPPDFSGNYLAVVNANVGGGKSDAFIKQLISLSAELGTDGLAKNRLIIKRRHEGQNQPDPWYKKDNLDFIQILAPKEAELISLTGGSGKTITPLMDYGSSDYKNDPDLLNWAQGGHLGKKTFSSWLRLSAGETGQLAAEYTTGYQTAGGRYQFIYEKQSGVETELELNLQAPPGFFWQESNSSKFYREVKSPEARLILELNLRPL